MAKTGTQHFEAVPIVELGREDALEVDIPVAQSIPSFTEDRGTTGLTSASSIPTMVEILAPANLHEGYLLDAVYNGISFPVIVPAGGCMKGQVLIVPFNLEAKMSTDRAWKDSLFACTRYGLIHPSLLCACCCPLILLGQIMTRLKMDWKGNEASPVEWNKTFRTMLLVGLFCKFFLVSMSDILDAILEWTYFFYLVYLLIKVRKYVRDRDQIPSEGYTTWEDIGVSIWCIPCAASQLARQTANYDQEIAYFLTQDGLSPNRARAVTTDNEYAGEIV